MQGTCVLYNPLKGWGFIWSEADDKEYFVHHSQIAGTGRRKLSSGDLVEFEVGQYKGESVAVSVRRILENGGAE